MPAAALVGLVAVVGSVLPMGEQVAADAAALRVVRHGEMSVERAAHRTTVLAAGGVLITGGCGGRGCDRVHASAELYDPDSRSFRPVDPMTLPRSSHASVALADGTILVAGGWTGESSTATAEIYDPTHGRFTAIGNMVESRIGPVAVPLPDGRVLILGGEVTTGAPLASTEIYDPATSTFSAAAPMRTPRGSHAAVVLADGRVLVTGGHRARGEILRSAEIFDPATGAFQPTGPMTIARHKHAAIRMTDGMVLIIGGSDSRDGRGRYASTEIYDPATGEFSPGPDMEWQRYKLEDAVVGYPSGAVLVVGGANRLEIFDPADRSFVPVEGELSGPLAFATADLLPTGEVLVLGGYDDRIQTSASAWLVVPGR